MRDADEDEPVLEGVTIFFDHDDDGIYDSETVTDVNGDYSLIDLPPGIYAVAEDISSAWVKTFPGILINESFETGDFDGWNILGNAGVSDSGFGINPIDGTYQALLTNGTNAVSRSSLETFLGLDPLTLNSYADPNIVTEGSAISQVISVEAGAILTFDWNFLSNEALNSPTFNDFAFISLMPEILPVPVLADTSDLIPFGGVYDNQTGYQPFSYTFQTAGTYVLGFGVVDCTDTGVDSALLIDNVNVTGAVPDSWKVLLGANDIVLNGDLGNFRVADITASLASDGSAVTRPVDEGTTVNFSALFNDPDTVNNSPVQGTSPPNIE